MESSIVHSMGGSHEAIEYLPLAWSDNSRAANLPGFTFSIKVDQIQDQDIVPKLSEGQLRYQLGKVDQLE